MITLKNGGTTSTTGGTDQSFTRTSETVTDGRMYADVAQADFFLWDKVSVKVKAPTVDPDGLYSKQKTEIAFVQPVVREDGKTRGYNTARIYVDYYPSTTSAQLTKLREYAAQLSKLAALDSTYNAGTLPD